MGHEEARFERLSPRMRECLRLVYARRSSKEIALALSTPAKPISENTVAGYIADAVKVLGARNRRDAAEKLQAFENKDPYLLTGQSTGVAPVISTDPDEAPWSPPPWRGPLPFRSLGATRNDLTILQRIAWIPTIAFAFAIGFGMLAVGLHFVSDLVRH